MHAVLIRETGGPEVLRFEEAQEPVPGEGEVLVEVRAAAINPIEYKQRRGVAQKQLPAILGSDVSGTVARSRAEAFAEGDEVFGFAASGAYAEFAIADARMIAAKPAALSHEQAAAIPVAGLTAWQALFDRAQLERGQSALIAGAAGGVGHFAVQFAKLGGGRALGIGSSRNRDFVRGLGADQYIDYTREDVGEAVSDVDVAFDTVGGDTTEALLVTVRDGGELVTIANAPPEQAAAERGVRASLLVMSPNAEQLARIAGLAAAGEVHIEIAETLPLSQVQRAHALSESGHTRGKIIVAPGT
jgi:NADPH:quinone reductase-like Zn-dependent oxidoreductase